MSSQTIGILLLRHKTAAGGIFVGKNDVGKFLRGEEDEILGEAGKMSGDAGERKEIVESEVAVAHGVETVCG